MYTSAVSTCNAHERPVTADLSAGFGRHLEGSLEGAPLLCGQDGSWSLGSLVLLPIIPSLPTNRDTTTILILTLYCKGETEHWLKGEECHFWAMLTSLLLLLYTTFSDRARSLRLPDSVGAGLMAASISLSFS